MYKISTFKNITTRELGGSILENGKVIGLSKQISNNVCDLYDINQTQPLVNNENASMEDCNKKYEAEGLIFGIGYVSEMLNPYIKEGFQKVDFQNYIKFNQFSHSILVNFIISLNQIETDNSMIYSFGEKTFATFYDIEMQLNSIETKKEINENEIYIEMAYLLNNKKQIIKRSYMKIDDLLANSISMISILMWVLRIINSYI